MAQSSDNALLTITPRIIGIAGGSCSGKTMLSDTLSARLGKDIPILRQDDYYHSIETDTVNWDVHNFDVPDAIDFEQLQTDIQSLKSGKIVNPPRYDFVTHKRIPNPQSLHPRDYIIVEGTMILCQSKLRRLIDHIVYIECNEDLRFSRRLDRDTKVRGRSDAEVRKQFQTQVKPCHDTYVRPSKAFADTVVEQNKYLQQFGKVIDDMIAKVTAP